MGLMGETRYSGQIRLEGMVGARPSWLITTVSHGVAQGVSRNFGGQVASDRAGAWHVRTECDSVSVILEEGDIRNRLVLGSVESPVHICDGERLLAPMSNAGEMCGCSMLPHARRAAARLGEGPSPDTHLALRLECAPELGKFLFASTSWEFAESVTEICALTESMLGPLQLEMRIENHGVVTSLGSEVRLLKPVLGFKSESLSDSFDFGLAS